MNIDVVTDGLAFPEGPRWHEGRLWVSDMHRQRVISVGEGGDVRDELVVENDPSGLGWLPDGRLLVVSMRDQRLLRSEQDGTLVEHADLSSIATFHCNDMVVSGDGTAYVGNFGADLDAGELALSTLAIVSADGTVRVGPGDMAFPNGTIITADGATLVVAETTGKRLSAFTIAQDGLLCDRRVWADLGGGFPDGICLDDHGAIWVADPVGHSCYRVLEGGEITDRFELGQPCYACVLGGSDGRTLFMCTAPRSGIATAELLGGRIEAVRVEVASAGSP